MASAAEVIRRRRRRRARHKSAQKRRHIGTGILAVLFVVLVLAPLTAFFGGAALIYWRATRDLPEPQATIALGPAAGPSRLFDRSGQTLLFSVEDVLGGQPGWIPLEDFPPQAVQAALMMEDPDFLEAQGFDAWQTLNRLWRNVIAGPLTADSSLTGRLVRNVIAPPPGIPTVESQNREIALVAEINRLYSAEEILEWHLNTNFYGNEAYGLEAAAQIYLNKSATNLTLDETALLAAVPLAPRFNPFDNETAARGRQGDVLRQMRVNDFISTEEFEAAATAQTLVELQAGQSPLLAPEFAIYARRQAEDILDSLGMDGSRLVTRGGLTITTTLDLDLYLQSECALRGHLVRLNGLPFEPTTVGGSLCQSVAFLPPESGIPRDIPPDEGVLALIDVTTGELRSMVGAAANPSYEPGPVLYPFVYFEGFRSGTYTPATMLLDIPTRFPGSAEGLIYTPQNPDGQFRGPLNLRDAMGAGLLPPVVQVANRVGLDTVLRRAHLIGLNSLEEGRHDLSLLERGGAVSALDVAYAYSVFATLGQMRGVSVEPVGRDFRGRDPVAVRRIEDAEGNVLWDYNEEQIALSFTTIFDAGLGYLINDVLADQNVRRSVFGLDNALELSRPGAVVNGITSSGHDAWAVGYTPQLTAAVRLGRADEQVMTLDPFSLEGAAPVWRAVMEYAHLRDGLPAVAWEQPDNIVETAVCERSGALPNDACPVRREIFHQNLQPFAVDELWKTVEVNSQNGKLATVNTPNPLRNEQIFFIPPAAAADWWVANNLPLPPTEIDDSSRPDLLSSARILEPTTFGNISGLVNVRGEFDTTNVQFYQLAYGQGINADEWVQIGAQGAQPGANDELGVWDTTALDGLYNLRLSVVMEDDTVETEIIQVFIDNIAPEIVLSAGGAERIYRWPDDRIIPLVAEVNDNRAIERVEFYNNGQLVGTDEEWPYGFDWDIPRDGAQTFSAIAIDAVGNATSSELTVDILRSG